MAFPEIALHNLELVLNDLPLDRFTNSELEQVHQALEAAEEACQEEWIRRDDPPVR